MATRQARRDDNKAGNLYSVKTGFNTIFTHPQLAETILQAVQLVSPVVIASNVLANLHVLRCLETEGNVHKLDQTFFSNCMYAVTHSTGRRAVQFDRAKDVKLTESLDLYLQQLPQGHQPPERPTYIKDLLNAASLMAHTNFKNHVSTNFFNRTLRWIRLQLGQQAFFANMEARFLSSWAKFVCRAAADNITNIWDLLPRYTSLVRPAIAIMQYLEYLVATMQQLMGPLPIASMQHAEYEVELDAAEATLNAIEEQLESDSPIMQAEGAHKFRRLARNHFMYTSTQGSRLLPTVVALLEAPSRDVRTAAAMAMADFGVHPDGREILRREGAIRPLVLLLGEGVESPAVEQAAKALMTLAASDINKDAIRQAEAIPALLGLLQASLVRPAASEAGTIKAVPAPRSHSIFGTPRAMPRTGPESSRGRPNRLSRPAAAHAAGAIMNLQMNAQNRIAIEQAGALGILQSIVDTGVENVAIDRAKYILTWMTVGADQDDFRAPKGDKTFEELLRDSHLVVEPAEEPAAKPVAPMVKPVAPSKLSKTALEPKRINGKKVGQTKEPEFKVQRPWGGYHTAAPS